MRTITSALYLPKKVRTKILLLSAMYLCQTISVGFVFGSMPVILRNMGTSLQLVGGLFLLHLPWALKFLYASWVDRYYIPAIGRRRSWIFPLQWLGALILLCVSQTPPETHFWTMYFLLLSLNIVMATNDIAVDGYATDILLPNERPWGNTIQSGARFLGLLLGGGLLLFFLRDIRLGAQLRAAGRLRVSIEYSGASASGAAERIRG